MCKIASAVVAKRTVIFSQRRAGDIASIVLHSVGSVHRGGLSVVFAENAKSVSTLSFIHGNVRVSSRPLAQGDLRREGMGETGRTFLFRFKSAEDRSGPRAEVLSSFSPVE